MAAISTRMPEVEIEYDSLAGKVCRRLRKHFTDAYQARSFYTAKLKAGRNPKVCKPGQPAPAIGSVSVPVFLFDEGDPNMPKTTTTKAAEAKKPAAKKPAAKKAAPTPAKAKPAKKATPAAPPTKSVGGLRKPQVRVLEALSEASHALSRREISEAANVDLAMLNAYIGAHDEDKRKHNDETFCPSLLTLGFVAYAPAENEDARGSFYKITAAGRKAVK